MVKFWGKSRNAKRIASGALALAIVASQVVLPANVEWGGLLKNSTITASAEDSSVEINISGVNKGESRVFLVIQLKSRVQVPTMAVFW